MNRQHNIIMPIVSTKAAITTCNFTAKSKAKVQTELTEVETEVHGNRLLPA